MSCSRRVNCVSLNPTLRKSSSRYRYGVRWERAVHKRIEYF